MCVVKMVSESYEALGSIFNLVEYVLRDKETGSSVRYFGGYNVNVTRASEQMYLVKEYYDKICGRQMRHFIVSFDECISPYDAWILGWRIAAYYADRFQIVFGVHEDSGNLHIHFVFNTVRFADGVKYSEGIADLDALKNYVNWVVTEYCNRA